MDADVIFALLAALASEEVDYKVIGGVAVNLQGYARNTEDIDLFVRPDSDNIARLRRALHSVFDDPNIDEITAEDLCGDYPAIQYVPPGAGFHVDILARLGDAFDYDSVEVETLEIEGVRAPVATRPMLIRMKRDTVRLKDKLDVQILQELLGEEESS